MTTFFVLVGAMVGAPGRYLIDRAMHAWLGDKWPWGTLTVNLTGSAVLGALAGAGAEHWLSSLAGVGFCGALTTFSTFGYQTVQLAERGRYVAALANVVVGVTLCVAAVYAGYALAGRVTG